MPREMFSLRAPEVGVRAVEVDRRERCESEFEQLARTPAVTVRTGRGMLRYMPC
jgi:hypothetical protein